MKAMAGDAEYQPVAAGRVPLPDGQEAVAKRQGFRQVRCAAASLYLLLIAVVGSRSAMDTELTNWTPLVLRRVFSC